MAIRMPEAINGKSEELSQEEWTELQNIISEAVVNFVDFRKTEGEILGADLEKSIKNIEEYLSLVCPFEEERLTAVKDRYESVLKEFENVDETRFFQEMSYYTEKVDISEEKVRLAQHLKYYLEVIRLNLVGYLPFPAAKMIIFIFFASMFLIIH